MVTIEATLIELDDACEMWDVIGAGWRVRVVVESDTRRLVVLTGDMPEHFLLDVLETVGVLDD